MADWRHRALRPLRRHSSTGHVRSDSEEPPELSMDPRSTDAETPVENSVVDTAVYVDGRRRSSPSTLAETFRSIGDPDSMAWIGLYRPAPAQLQSLADQFGLHELAVEDAIVAHQRPKLERYGDTLFVVLRSALYDDEREEVDFGEIHVFVGRDFVVTVRHSEAPDLGRVRRRMEEDPELLAMGPEAVLYAILDAVVDGFAPVVAGVQNDVDEIETEVFGGDPAVSRRIYELSREVIEFQRATRPLPRMIASLSAGFEKYSVNDDLRQYLRDVADHATTVVERVDGLREMLQNILTVNATMVSQAQNTEMQRLSQAGWVQNEEIKKISSWAAILFAPTLVGTVYGMNFDFMPETHWAVGYPMAIALMLLTSVTLYRIFKHRGWL